MKALHDKVNVVPLIAKADCLTPGEMKKLKERVKRSTQGPQMNNNPIIFSVYIRGADWCGLPNHVLCVLSSQVKEDIDKYSIKIYQFPDCDSDEEEELKRQDKELKVPLILPKMRFLACLERRLNVELQFG